MLERLPELVNGDPVLVRRGRFLSTRFLVGVGETEYLVDIREGRIERVERGPFVMPSWRFALRGSAEAWRKFWQAVPPPGHHDLFALSKRGLLAIEGDLHPLMANLLYLKDVLAAPRRLGARS
ncbi:MAG TPA: hypothetical protein VJN67_16490 [Stellaceae bacterium]|nr:hypothetical protein [Stellaceae bacterium]